MSEMIIETHGFPPGQCAEKQNTAFSALRRRFVSARSLLPWTADVSQVVW
jgi:hypothetical protein